MDNPEGQVTYPIYIGRLGYLPALAYLKNMHCVFILFLSYKVQYHTIYPYNLYILIPIVNLYNHLFH